MQLACAQKYWHKGAFFQGEDEDGESVLGDIMARDYDAPTGEDNFDKEALPKIMQVRPPGIALLNCRSPQLGSHCQSEALCQRALATAETSQSAGCMTTSCGWLQVRGGQFGKRGRTKWTHLLAEDTTAQANPASLGPVGLARPLRAQDFAKPRRAPL